MSLSGVLEYIVGQREEYSMRPQESPLPHKEKFGFTEGELIVQQTKLPDHYPQVVVLNDASIVASAVTSAGEMYSFEHGDGNSWQASLEPNSRLVSVQTGDKPATLDFSEHADGSHVLGGEVTGEYQIQPGDLLMVQVQSSGPRTVELLSADANLPAREGAMSYAPLAVITEAGALITWGEEGRRTRKLVDWALANQLATDKLHTYILAVQISNPNKYTLIGQIESDRVARTYLRWFQERFSQDYMPTEEPIARLRRLPGQLTGQEIGRHLVPR